MDEENHSDKLPPAPIRQVSAFSFVMVPMAPVASVAHVYEGGSEVGSGIVAKIAAANDLSNN